VFRQRLVTLHGEEPSVSGGIGSVPFSLRALPPVALTQIKGLAPARSRDGPAHDAHALGVGGMGRQETHAGIGQAQ
jgi:hypothetical protein